MNIIKDRKNWIDIAKGISILSVIVGHLLLGPTFLRNLIFSFNMPLFLLLSGYTLKPCGNFLELKSKIKKDFKRLYFPAILVIFITKVLQITTRGGVTYWLKSFIISIFWGNGLNYQFKNLYFQSVGPVWFLITLFYSKLFFQISMMIVKKQHNIAYFAFIALLGVIIGKKVWLLQNFDLVLVSSFFLYIGYVMKEQQIFEKRIYDIVYILIFSIWILLVQAGIFSELAVRSYPYYMLSLLCGIIGSYCIIELSINIEQLPFSSYVLRNVGQNSLLILCIHSIENKFLNWMELINVYNLVSVIIIRVLFYITLSMLIMKIKPILRCFKLKLMRR